MAATHGATKQMPDPAGQSSSSTLTSKFSWRKFTVLSPLILANIVIMLLSTGGQLLLRVYFLHGGKRLMWTTAIQLCGFPVLLLPMALSPRPKVPDGGGDAARKRISLPFLGSLVLVGLIFSVCSYLFSLGSSYLPLSTSSLLWSTQLAFNAFFALVLVRQRFSPFSMNAVVLLTIGPIVLGLGAGSDMPAGETRANYILGFGMMVSAAALNGFVLPLVEWIMSKWAGKANGGMNYRAVMEMLFLLEFAGTIFCLVGMAITGDYKAIGKEAESFGLGEAKYYLVMFWDAIFWQLYNVGIFGLISCASSLLAGVVVAVLLPVTELLSLVFLHEKFNGNKGVALALSIWGFASYLYGEHKQNKSAKKTADGEIAIATTV